MRKTEQRSQSNELRGMTNLRGIGSKQVRGDQAIPRAKRASKPLYFDYVLSRSCRDASCAMHRSVSMSLHPSSSLRAVTRSSITMRTSNRDLVIRFVHSPVVVPDLFGSAVEVSDFAGRILSSPN